METDKVIKEGIEEGISCNNSDKQVPNNEENEGTENNKLEINQVSNNCDKFLIENNTANVQSCSPKNDVNDQLNLLNDTNVNHNETSVNSDNNEPQTIDLTVSGSIQTDEVSIIHEENNGIFVTNDGNNGNKLSSLTTIALEYGDSDSETESSSSIHKQNYHQPVALKEVQMQPYRISTNKSSSEESDSEDDSTSISDSSVSIDSDDSDNDDRNKKNKEIRKTKEQRNDIKSELDDLPPIEDLKISVPEVLCDPLGEVAWIVEPLVIVQPRAEKPTLNLDTVLFVEKGKRALGKIFDVFGQVKEPYYCVRFNSPEHIRECDVKVGMTVYYCPNTEYTSLVFVHELLKIKGVDANADDPPDFSDDEEEQAYYAKLKQEKQAGQTPEMDAGDLLVKRKRVSSPNPGWQSNHPWNRNKQKNRKGHHPRGFPFMQARNQLQNPWMYPYQNSWQSMPGDFHSNGAESCGYGIYPPGLSMQYGNFTTDSMNQNFYDPHGYYSESGIPYNMPSGAHPEFMMYQNRSHLPSNPRFRNPNVTWESQMPARMNTPWISLPPPPPPPPPSKSPSSPKTD
ncbi:uncharacterized protein LOC144471830 [Augochlora pura]